MIRSTMGGMAKRKTTRETPPPDDAEAARGDRHTSPFMIRLPESFREAIREYQARHRQEHGFRPTMTDVIRAAIAEFLVKRGVPAPPDA